MNRREVLQETMPSLPESVKSETNPFRHICAGQLNFRVFVQGDGPPVLLFHGFPDTLTVWRKLIPHLLAAGYQVIAFDQRGCGESDAPRGTENYRIAQIVDDIPLLLDALGIRQPVGVIGHDWGAAIAWGLAIFHPARVHSLVAASVGHLQSYGRAGFTQKFVKGFYTLWFQLRGVAEWELLRDGGKGLRHWLGDHADFPDILARMQRPGRLTAALAWYRANLFSVLFHRWPRCAVPTLGLWSEHDAYLTEAQMKDSARFVDAPWRYQRIADCGHWIPLERPEELAAAAIDWFDRYGRPKA